MADAGRFINPVLGGDRPDPAVIQVGDKYWMTYSSFESAPGLPLYRSHDLVNWTYECAALPEPLGSTFAVDIAEHDGRFFIYIPFLPAPWSQFEDDSRRCGWGNGGRCMHRRPGRQPVSSSTTDSSSPRRAPAPAAHPRSRC